MEEKELKNLSNELTRVKLRETTIEFLNHIEHPFWKLSWTEKKNNSRQNLSDFINPTQTGFFRIWGDWEAFFIDA